MEMSDNVIEMDTIWSATPDNNCKEACTFDWSQDIKRVPFGFYDLIEVFSLRVVNRQGKHLYANVKADDNTTMHLLYDRQKKPKAEEGHYESEEEEDSDDDDELLMIGPNEYNLIGCDPGAFILTLMNEITNISYRFRTLWRGTSREVYDVPLTATMTCDIGTVILTFAVFAVPAAAKVQVALINDDNNNGDVDICGWITARNSLFERPEVRTLLFRKKKQHKMLKKQKTSSSSYLIPLSKSIVAVPLTSSLILEMDLFDGNTGQSIARGKQEFKPHYDENNVKGIPNSNIQVSVTWKGIYKPPSRFKSLYTT